jgi:hypothetical protein
MTLAARRAGSRSAIGAALAAHVGLPGCDAAALQRLAVTEEQTATWAIQALGLRRDGASLGVLTGLLSGPDHRVARAAGDAIAARGTRWRPTSPSGSWRWRAAVRLVPPPRAGPSPAPGGQGIYAARSTRDPRLRAAG